MNWFTEKRLLLKRIKELEENKCTNWTTDEYTEYLEDKIIQLEKRLNAKTSSTSNGHFIKADCDSIFPRDLDAMFNGSVLSGFSRANLIRGGDE